MSICVEQSVELLARLTGREECLVAADQNRTTSAIFSDRKLCVKGERPLAQIVEIIEGDKERICFCQDELALERSRGNDIRTLE